MLSQVRKEFKISGKLDAAWGVSMNTVTPSRPRLQVKGKPHSALGRARHVVEKPGQHQVFFFLVQRPNQVILGTMSVSRESPTSRCWLCCSEPRLLFA